MTDTILSGTVVALNPSPNMPMPPIDPATGQIMSSSASVKPRVNVTLRLAGELGEIGDIIIQREEGDIPAYGAAVKATLTFG